MNTTDYTRTDVLIVGAGPAGLAAAILLKTENPRLEVCIIEKAADTGNHNLSGAVLEMDALKRLLDNAIPGWETSREAEKVIGKPIDQDDILFFLGNSYSVNMVKALKLARAMQLDLGQMIHEGDYCVSVSELCHWLGNVARQKGVELYTGFSAEQISYSDGAPVRVKLVDQGKGHNGEKQPNFVPGETLTADFVLLCEGSDGLLTESFIKQAGLKRNSPQLYSLGIKERIRVDNAQYRQFGTRRVVHAMGYPLYNPVTGPGMFGGGIIYSGDKNHLSVGVIVGVDWKYHDFSPQQALQLFKQHSFVKPFIADGKVVETGAKMIPEGGWHAIPRSEEGEIGRHGVMILGDSAGFVNMHKIKGLHNAIESGMLAAQAILEHADEPQLAARTYTRLVDQGPIGAEMRRARNYRQLIARFGVLLGTTLDLGGRLWPRVRVEEDRRALKKAPYRYKPATSFDRDTFVALSGAEHREDQPGHVQIQNPSLCMDTCEQAYGLPCLTFCPASVYETINGQLKAANASNCLHCKCCQQKCPYDNVFWTVPEGSGGPRYRSM